MQPTGGGGSNSELSRGGLTRFRSAPVTWLEALLESEEENDVVLDPPSIKQPPPPTSHSLSQPRSTTTPTPTSRYVDPGLFDGGGAGFLRQNSSPAEFLSQISSGSDGYFPNFGVSAKYDYLSSSLDVSPSCKRPREGDSEDPSVANLSSQLKGEQNGLSDGEMGGLLDAEMEKLFEDAVPCRVRAKRGCATHPRSIAERVRRTRISDRIRKLQELVPNMDKQTNTADMLEEAVEYVKYLQKQIQELTEHQKKCKCLDKD